MSALHIFAYDSLFVRDGKPFSMGEDTWASGIFPPPPSVFYGALRTRYFSENPQDLPKANTDEDPTKDLRITGLGYLVKIGKLAERIFPAPYDLVENEEANLGDRNKFLLLQCQDDYSGTSATMPRLEISGADNVEVMGGGAFVKELDFEDYLKGAAPYAVLPNGKLWTTEPKIGIAKDRFTGSSQQGKLYRSGLVRPETFDTNSGLSNFGFWLETSGLPAKLAVKGNFKLGGEGKMAYYQENVVSQIQAAKPKGTRLKIYLATPGIFKNGYLPDTTQGIWKKHNIKIHTMASGKPLLIGGFSMKNDHQFGPKPMRKAVPPGTVYFVEIGGDVEKAILDIHGKCISDEFSETERPAQQGFGLAYVGLTEHQNY
jgi:CRISPR-associated protein Cmr3